MEVDVLSYSPETQVLMVKCSGRFAMGSAGVSEPLLPAVKRWIVSHADSRVTEIVVDFREVEYSWGDGPVSSMVSLLHHGVSRFRFLASPSNQDALTSLIKASKLPGFVISRSDGIEVESAETSQSNGDLTAPRDKTASERDDLDDLDQSISDVGYWRRWDAELPEWVQLEFGGVQLAVSETGIALPRPVETLTLRFLRPSCATFITSEDEWDAMPLTLGDVERQVLTHNAAQRPSASGKLTADWPRQLRQGSLGPLAIRHDRF